MEVFRAVGELSKKIFTNFRNSNSLRQIMVLYAVVGFDQYLLHNTTVYSTENEEKSNVVERWN